MAKWWIGCSGFHYKHWKNIFYPEGLASTKWFDFYNTHFKTLELNVTFYRFPRLSVLQPWYSKSPEQFKFSVKAPKAITHYKQFIKVENYLSDFYGTVQEGLKDKLGCVLFQLPERIAYKPPKLIQIVESLNPDFRNVLEFRNKSWWNKEVYEKLAAHNITFCGMSHPLLPNDIVQNTSNLYYRFHGVPELYKSKYQKAFLKEFAELTEANEQTEEAYIYFNNDIDGSAITNAYDLEALVEKLQKRKVRL